MAFKKAVKKQAKLRIALSGASGSGKTMSALILAETIGKKVAVIDTERGSASLYADKFDFDVLDLKPPFEPEKFISAIKEAEFEGYDVIVLDSITHEWEGEGGILDILNKLGGRMTDWGTVTPRHDRFVNAILGSGCHIIATMRSKTSYEAGTNDKGKTILIKQGTAPKQRDGIDYEFTVVFDINQNHLAKATKDRTELFDGKDFVITAETGRSIVGWLESAAPAINDDLVTSSELLPFYKFVKSRCSEEKYNEICTYIAHKAGRGELTVHQLNEYRAKVEKDYPVKNEETK